MHLIKLRRAEATYVVSVCKCLTERGFFEATLEYHFLANIWVDFNLVLRFSSNSDGSGDLGEISCVEITPKYSRRAVLTHFGRR